MAKSYASQFVRIETRQWWWLFSLLFIFFLLPLSLYQDWGLVSIPKFSFNTQTKRNFVQKDHNLKRKQLITDWCFPSIPSVSSGGIRWTFWASNRIGEMILLSHSEACHYFWSGHAFLNHILKCRTPTCMSWSTSSTHKLKY